MCTAVMAMLVTAVETTCSMPPRQTI